uniref:Uncharacterized protein n=1 Tax=Arundo donax TaxID=35708 RepID=A0A0A9H754_ARUDO
MRFHSYHASAEYCSTRHAIKRQVFGADHSYSFWYIRRGPSCFFSPKKLADTSRKVN